MILVALARVVSGGAYTAKVPTGHAWHEDREEEPGGLHNLYARWGQITHSTTFATPVADEYDPPGQQMPLLHGVLVGVTDEVAPNEREEEGDAVRDAVAV